MTDIILFRIRRGLAFRACSRRGDQWLGMVLDWFSIVDDIREETMLDLATQAERRGLSVERRLERAI